MYPPPAARLRGSAGNTMPATDDVILDIVASQPMSGLPTASQGGSSSTSSTAPDAPIDMQPAQDHVHSDQRHRQCASEQHSTDWSTRKQSSNGTSEFRQVFRIDRDYTAGEICQFSSKLPLEMEGRVGVLVCDARKN